MKCYGIFDIDNNELVIDEQCEGNNNKGLPILCSSRALAQELIETDFEGCGPLKVIAVKLSFKKPK